MKKYPLSLLFAGVIMCFGSPVRASDQSSQDFTQQYFVNYSAQTAYDMSKVIPGFQADYGQSVRGFSGGGGNILIDGKRPSVKSGNLSDILKNIPAADVLKIQLWIGSAGVGDAAQQSSVINIVRLKKTSSLRLETTANYVDQGAVRPKVLINYSSFWDNWTYQINSLYNAKKTPTISTVDEFSQAGTTTNTYHQTQVAALDEYTLTTNATHHGLDNQLDLYNTLKWSRYHPITSRRLGDNSSPFFHNDRESKYVMAELGADYNYSMSNDWKARWQGIFLINQWDVNRQTLEFSQQLQDESPKTQYDYVFDRLKTESILRGTWQNSTLFLSPEFGLEVAHNQSEFTTDYSKFENEVTTQIPLTAANVTVAELRSEMFVRGSHSLSSHLTLNFSLAAEYSKLTVTGDAQNEDNYAFFKPSLSLVYAPNDRWTWETQLTKSAGQLDFRLFAAQSNQIDNRNVAGNPALKPDSKVRLNSKFNVVFTNKAALTVALFHDWRSDVLEQMILPSGHSGTGNSGDAKVIGLSTQLMVPLDGILPNGQLSINAETSDGDFFDVTSGTSRELTGTTKPEISLTLRQDNIFNGLSWGTTYTAQSKTSHFYVSELSKQVSDDRWQFFINKEVIAGWNLKLEMSKLGNPSSQKSRYFYTINRAQTVNGVTRQNIKQPWEVALSLSVVL